MKNNTLITVIACLALTLMGCPYSSSVNLGKAEIKTDNSIIKKWKQGTDYFYKVLKYDEYSYTIKKISQTTGDLSETYIGYITDIDGTKYMTVHTDGSSSPSYYFYKFEQSGTNKITLTPVTENIDETFTSPSDLFSFFKKNQKNSYFFDNDEEEYTAVEE
ncbi:MAG: hypothetical protein V4613_06540 [Bacteroidota bacterium]